MQPTCQPTCQPTSFLYRIDLVNTAIQSLQISTINCTALKRERLDAYKCGNCFEKYLGDSSNSATACVDERKAIMTLKACPNDCFNNGKCIYLDIASYTAVSTCYLQNTSCFARCNCNDYYHGADCKVTSEQNVLLQKTQSSALFELQKIASTTEPTIFGVQAAINATVFLFEISTVSDMTDNSIYISSRIVAATMNNVAQLSIPLPNIMGYSSMISSCIELSMIKVLDNSVKSSIQLMYESYVSNIGKLVTKDSINNTSNSTIITAKNMQIVIERLKPVTSILSLSSKSSHEVRFNFINAISGRRLSVSDVPKTMLVMSVTRSIMYDYTLNTSSSLYYKITSNPLRIQLNCGLINHTTVQMTLQNSEHQLLTPIQPVTNPIVTTCVSYKRVDHIYVCTYEDNSKYNLTVTCDGSNNVTYTTSCPPRNRVPSCKVLSQLGKCSLVGHSPYTTTCSCDICAISDTDGRRLVSANTLSYQVASMTEYIYSDYVSVASSTSFSTKTVEITVIVYVTFAVVWLALILSVPLNTVVYQHLDKQKKSIKPSTSVTSVVPEDMVHQITLKSRLREYLSTILPSVYKESQGYTTRIMTQILHNHLYLSLFYRSKQHNIYLRYLEILRIITILSSSMFTLVVLFSAQFQSDDRTCPTLTTTDFCLKRKNFLGDDYCVWESGQCSYSQPKFTLLLIIYLSWLELLILSPIACMVTFIFNDIILAPSHSYVQDQLSVKHTSVLARRMSQFGRRLSQVGSNIRRLSIQGVNQARRMSSVIPAGTVDSDLKKRASAVRKTIAVNQQLVDLRSKAFSLLTYHNHNPRHLKSIIELEDVTDVDISQALYQNAITSIKVYRRGLDDDDRSRFDHFWDQYFVDPGDSSIQDKYNLFSRSLYNEVSSVQERSSEIFAILKSTPKHVLGVELLKTFFIDLLGRGTDEASIFESAFDNSLKAKRVVSIYLKIVMISFMVLLNIFFVYLSMLYSSDKGYDWQVRWLITFISNFGIEITFNCMSEAYILKYLVPTSIDKKIGTLFN